MIRIVLADEVEYEKVEWGLTKELITPQTVRSQKIKVKITEYLPGHVHKLHVHPHQEEVLYVLSGKGITDTQDGEKEIGPGSTVFVPAGITHTTWNSSNSESLKVIVIKAPPDDEEIEM